MLVVDNRYPARCRPLLLGAAIAAPKITSIALVMCDDFLLMLSDDALIAHLLERDSDEES